MTRRPRGDRAWGDLSRWESVFLEHYVKASLHRRIFVLLGAAIVVSSLMVAATIHGSDAGAAHHHPRWPLVALFIVGLWASSGKIARRLTAPFVELARVAQEIGKGNLSARYAFGRRGRTREAALIGVSINRMAERIEQQLKDQRELLAAVSHEVRTPLARIRMLAELGRTRPDESGARFVVDAKTFDDIDREVVEIDALVGELLASSRLDFAALTCADLDAADVAGRALERQSLSPPPRLDLPEGDGAGVRFRADPTLVQRALANLLTNASVHAGGVDALVVEGTAGSVRFVVLDRGPGLAPGDEAKIFASFTRGAGAAAAGEERASGLGLGLALVDRIARAHGGHAFAASRTDGPGARVGFELPRRGPLTEG